METLVVRVEDKKTARLIKRMLEEVKRVVDVGIAKNNYISDAIEEYELQEDIKAYDAAKALPSDPVDLDEVLLELKKAGKL